MSYIGLIGRATAISLTGNMLVKLISITTTFLVLHKLSLYEYGLLEIAMASLGALSILQLPGVVDMLISDVSTSKLHPHNVEASSLLKGYFWTQLLLSGVYLVIGSVIASVALDNEAYSLAATVAFLSLTTLLLPFRTIVQTSLTASLRYKALTAYAVFEEGLKLFFLILFFSLIPFGIEVVPLALLASQVVTILLFVLFIIKIDFIKETTLGSVNFFLKAMSRHGKWSIILGYVNSLSQSLRLWIIKVMLGTEAVAIYAVAQGVLNHLSSLLPLAKITGPITARFIDDKQRVARLFSKTLKYQFILSLVGGLAGLVILPSLLSIAFPQYDSAFDLFKWMVPTLVPLGFAAAIVPLYMAIKDQKSLSVISFYRVLCIAILLPPFIALFGIVGAALEQFVVALLYSGERFRVLKKNMPWLGFRLSDIYTVDEDDKLILGKIRNKFDRKYE